MMSQKKTKADQQVKNNRVKTIQKERWIHRLGYGAAAVVLAALVVWFSVAVYKNVEAGSASATTTTEMDMTAVSDYLNGIN
ncbi:hypothetical protein INP51_08250 [Blautia liquoris]|jgi:hypothetical protein|uniref:Uncharacterized protein n=1 Tax=Blautia liquoris TaxID=2779518 RepID=A0A7M2RCJ1_9FIRM|nr:hypothetical protein [Blautia liquoris]QOV18049.1 hypothetical protein INP51_08250 [Blautia liquoris]